MSNPPFNAGQGEATNCVHIPLAGHLNHYEYRCVQDDGDGFNDDDEDDDVDVDDDDDDNDDY